MKNHTIALGTVTALCVALALSTKGWDGADLIASVAVFAAWIWWCREDQKIHG